MSKIVDTAKIVVRNVARVIPDEPYLKVKYRLKIGKPLHLNPPVTFNEKMQWLKMHNRKPEYTTMVDKYEVKKYVAEKIGEEYIVPTLGVWDSFDEIDFDALPDQFVLKCTHDSGGLVICRDKATLDKDAVRKKIKKSLRKNYYWQHREWPYKNVKRRIIAEQLLEGTEPGRAPDDYKLYCFDGKMKAIGIFSGRGSGHTTVDYFDRNFQWLNFSWTYNNAEQKPQKPTMYEEMIRIAEELSKGIPHVRVDLYQCGEKIYFGEMTFFHGSGLDKIEPAEWDKTLGSWISL